MVSHHILTVIHHILTVTHHLLNDLFLDFCRDCESECLDKCSRCRHAHTHWLFNVNVNDHSLSWHTYTPVGNCLAQQQRPKCHFCALSWRERANRHAMRELAIVDGISEVQWRSPRVFSRQVNTLQSTHLLWPPSHDYSRMVVGVSNDFFDMKTWPILKVV